MPPFRKKRLSQKCTISWPDASLAEGHSNLIRNWEARLHDTHCYDHAVVALVDGKRVSLGCEKNFGVRNLRNFYKVYERPWV